VNAQHLVSKFIRFLRGLRAGLAHATIKPRVESGAGPKLTNIQLQLVAQLTPGKCELAHNSAAKPYHYGGFRSARRITSEAINLGALHPIGGLLPAGLQIVLAECPLLA
jgi:hypothetical protein